MLSWRGAALGADRGTINFCVSCILLLPDDSAIVRGACSKTALNEPMIQVQEGARRNARRADLHPGACGPIQHPGRHHNDHTGRRLNMNELTSNALFAVKPPNTPPVQRMPAIMDLDFLADMGRINGRLPSGGGTGPSPAAAGPPSSTTIRTLGSPTCSLGSPTIRRNESTSSCPGTGKNRSTPPRPETASPPIQPYLRPSPGGYVPAHAQRDGFPVGDLSRNPRRA